jgi:hypothetical protein
MNAPTDPPHDMTTATAYTNVDNSLTSVSRELPRRLLGIWAHPDDEAYLSAGLMARVISSPASPSSA